MLDAVAKGKRLEAIDELCDLVLIVQRMGRRLAEDTHGDAYALVRNLNELLHQTRVACFRIQDEASRGA